MVNKENVKDFEKNRSQYEKASNKKDFLYAIEDIDAYIKNPKVCHIQICYCY